MPNLFADAGGLPAWMIDLGPRGVDTLLEIGCFTLLAMGVIAIPLTALVLHHRRAAMKHRERMTMIEAGMHPDFPPLAPEPAPAPDLKKSTIEYRPTA